jgi:hypothetical protein
MPWTTLAATPLAPMRLWLQIEQQLATALPLERLEFDTTPSKLIALIEKLVEAPDRGAEVVSLHPQQPLIFLMPPAHGYAIL